MSSLVWLESLEDLQTYYISPLKFRSLLLWRGGRLAWECAFDRVPCGGCSKRWNHLVRKSSSFSSNAERPGGKDFVQLLDLVKRNHWRWFSLLFFWCWGAKHIPSLGEWTIQATAMWLFEAPKQRPQRLWVWPQAGDLCWIDGPRRSS